MVVALFVVAFAMVVAGLAAIYDGYAIIVMEKGWTKVIAGAVAASAGFLLFGVTAVIAQLKRIGADLAQLRERGRLDALQPPVQAGTGAGEAPTAGALGTASLGEASASPRSGGPAEAAPPDARDIVAPEPPHGGAPGQPAPDQEGERPPDQARPARQAAPEQQAPTVVGTYSSGGNTYVMYSDGSIRAETPTGLYRFDSLDELKAFIAAGGESPPPAR